MFPKQFLGIGLKLSTLCYQGCADLNCQKCQIYFSQARKLDAALKITTNPNEQWKNSNGSVCPTIISLGDIETHSVSRMCVIVSLTISSPQDPVCRSIVSSWWQSKLPSASTVVSSPPFCQEEKHMHDRITSMHRRVNIQAIGANTWWHVNCKSECATILGLSSISFCSLLPPWLPVYVFSLNLLLLYWQFLN